MVVFAASFATVVSADGAYVVKATQPRARAPLLPVLKTDREGANERHELRWGCWVRVPPRGETWRSCRIRFRGLGPGISGGSQAVARS